MTNSTSSSSFKIRSHTAPVTKTVHRLHLQQKRLRSGSLLVQQDYVPVFYKNPDPELTKRLKSFLQKAPLNSSEDLRLKSASRLLRSHTATPDKSRSSIKNGSYYRTPCESFSHLLPEKQTIHQLVLPPIYLGCTDNFSRKYDHENRSDDEFITMDLSVQMEHLKYCRYLRVRSAIERTKE